MKALAYYDGKIGAPEELTVPFNDRVHFFGDGCYDADTLNGLSVGGRDAATRVAIQNAVLQDFRDCTGFAGLWI